MTDCEDGDGDREADVTRREGRRIFRKTTRRVAKTAAPAGKTTSRPARTPDRLGNETPSIAKVVELAGNLSVRAVKAAHSVVNLASPFGTRSARPEKAIVSEENSA